MADGLATAVRGRGLMLGLETAGPIARATVAAARDRHGLLVNATGDTTLRLVPPLVIGADEVDLALERLGRRARRGRGMTTRPDVAVPHPTRAERRPGTCSAPRTSRRWA